MTFLDPFEITSTEITQAQFLTATGRLLGAFSCPTCYDGFTCPNCPANRVASDDAKYVCELLGGRIPSEAEWEYAARGGRTTRYPCGDSEDCLGGNSTELQRRPTRDWPMASGLYGAAGNVWEWVEDIYHPNYLGAPTDGAAWNFPGAAKGQVLRGGAFGEPSASRRVSARSYPGAIPDDRRIGFRCVRDLAIRPLPREAGGMWK